MKKRILCILLLSVLLFTFGCAEQETIPNETESTTPKYHHVLSGTPPQKVTPTTPYPGATKTDAVYSTSPDELTVYNYNDFESGLPRRNFSFLTNFDILVSWEKFDTNFPIQRIKRLDNSHVCIIYRLRNANGTECFAYIILDTLSDSTSNTPDDAIFDGEYYFVSKQLSYSDFAAISKGTLASKIEEIDPAIAFDLRDFYFNEKGKGFTTYWLLSDGLLVITLSDIATPNFDTFNLSHYEISTMEFYPYGATDIPENVSVLHYPDLIEKD